MAARTRQLLYKADYSDGDVSGPYVTAISSSTDMMLLHPNGKVGLTSVGGLAVKLTNATNATISIVFIFSLVLYSFIFL